jgi:4-hydroxy-2-oxovalerate/4-hydroxy-2-oxohexanoate aldolase
MTARHVRLVDETLRDGSHTNHHRFTPDQVKRHAELVDAAGIWAIVVGHGDGLGGSSLHSGFGLHSDPELIGAAAEVARTAKVATLLVPGLGTRRDLEAAAQAGATLARIGTMCTEGDTGFQHIGLARDLGLEVISMLAMIHTVSPERLAAESTRVAVAGAQVVDLVDTAGALLPDEVGSRVAAVRDALPDEVDVSFHAHNNLSLAVANSLAAIDAGAGMVDVSLAGLGAGAGNCQAEALATVCRRLGIDTGVDVFALQDAADDYVRRELMEKPIEIDRVSLTLGYTGVPAALMLHIEAAAERFGVDPRDLVVALGERKAVIGQEDLVVEVAAQLSAAGRP